MPAERSENHDPRLMEGSPSEGATNGERVPPDDLDGDELHAQLREQDRRVSREDADTHRSS
jgi:hypothetical protein